MRTTFPRPRPVAAFLLCALGALPLGARCASAQSALPAALSSGAPRAPSPADAAFLAGMIEHHRQAVVMAGWAASHEAGPAVRELCARILVSQRDEIATMARWLREHGQAVPDSAAPAHAMSGAGTMPGMAAMPGMGSAPAAGAMAATPGDTLMPGMLTPGQLAQLDAARGSAFDRLFLRLMIQHHQGALTMVERLVSTSGAAQDPLVFQLASGIDADQSAEIDRMRRMLAAMPPW